MVRSKNMEGFKCPRIDIGRQPNHRVMTVEIAS